MASSASRGALSREMFRSNSNTSDKNILKEVSMRLNSGSIEHPEERNLWRLSDLFFNIEQFIIEEHRESAK